MRFLIETGLYPHHILGFYPYPEQRFDPPINLRKRKKMTSISSVKVKDCPICLEKFTGKKKVSLDCTFGHKTCLDCATKMFGQMKEGVVQTSKACPWRCVKPVTSYVTIISDPAEALPKALNLVIFSYLKRTDLPFCCQTSKKWNRLANDKKIWKKIAIQLEKEWKGRDSIGSMMGKRIAKLKGEGLSNTQIKWHFDMEYRRMHGGFPCSWVV